MYGNLLEDLVDHIETQYQVCMADHLRKLARNNPFDGSCPGERMVQIAAIAADMAGCHTNDILDRFGRSRAGGCDTERACDDATLEVLIGHLQSLLNDASIAAQAHCLGDRIEITVFYRDCAGCADIIAGWLAAWAELYLVASKLCRQELSPVAGSHTQFKLCGTIAARH